MLWMDWKVEKTMKPELIIFDCDGTLADSESLHQIAVINALDECGFHGYTREFCFEHFVGRGMAYVQYFIEEREGRKLPEDFIARYVYWCEELMRNGVMPVTGAMDAVATLAKDYRLCVGSNGEPENVLTTITSMGMLDYFGAEHVYTKSQVARGKPAPDLFLYAAEQMGVAPYKCVVVEDSMTGIAAGLAAGMVTIGITAAAHDPAFTNENMKKAGVEYIYHSWPEIVDFIKSL